MCVDYDCGRCGRPRQRIPTEAERAELVRLTALIKSQPLSLPVWYELAMLEQYGETPAITAVQVKPSRAPQPTMRQPARKTVRQTPPAPHQTPREGLLAITDGSERMSAEEWLKSFEVAPE